jgi:acetyl-CoA synthetase
MDAESTSESATIEDYYREDRTFPPSPEFVAQAVVSDPGIYERAEADPEGFWAEQARSLLTWEQDFHTTLEWEPPFARWFVGGRLNVAVNCVDRHVASGLGDRVAIHWEGEPGDTRTITYADLQREVCRCANALADLGVSPGDRVCIYLPMIPEAVISMLACARLGAAHSVVFGGFSPDALIDRINDAGATVVITADAGYRRGVPFPLKPNVDVAVAACPTVQSVLVVDRCGTDIEMHDGRDHWWDEHLGFQPDTHTPEAFDSEQLLFLLYTSGTTARPKGIMHTSGGYLTQVAWTHRAVFDLHPETDVYWCAADVGWVTGHSYIVYGPLANAATIVMYEGTPDTPRGELRTGDGPGDWDKDRLWDIVERYKVTQLYTAPTAIRTFMKWGAEWPERHDLSSLRVLGTVGEPINPEAWMWYHRHIGGERCPIVDTWWQTETGGHMISPLPAITATKPGSACHPLPGIGAELVDDEGNVVERGGGYLTLTRPWPSMLRGIWGDPERYRETYWSRFEGRYFAGDGAKIDDDGYLWVLGRVDDVMNVSGHRISTAEVESALVDHPAVAEAAVVGASDPTTGQAIVGYVILRGSYEASEQLREEIRQHVAAKLGAIARPKAVILVSDLPKTRSGKIMRRLLRDVVEGRELGDTTTLADATVVEAIREGAAASTED